MKVEMVVHGLIAAGMEMVVVQLTRGLASRGHDVGVTCIEFEGTLGRSLRNEGFRVSLVPTPGIAPIFFPRKLGRWLRDLRPDVVHIHSGAWIKAARAASWAGVPRVVFTLHGLEGDEPWHESVLNRWAARTTDAIAVVSRPLVDHLAGIDQRKIHVVPNGVDTGRFSPTPDQATCRRAVGLPVDALIVGHVARLSPVKNQRFLIDAFSRILAGRPDAFLVLVGDGPLRQDLVQFSHQLGAADRILFLGERSDLPDLFRSFDVFVLPSLLEGTSMSILEAMASGLPVVASAVGGTPDLLAPGECGVLFDSGDTDAFVLAVNELLASDRMRQDLGMKARRRAEAAFSEQGVISRYEALYERHARPAGPVLQRAS
jgi:glycosyltransferase involved in cell wall biosynthesis